MSLHLVLTKSAWNTIPFVTSDNPVPARDQGKLETSCRHMIDSPPVCASAPKKWQIQNCPQCLKKKVGFYLKSEKLQSFCSHTVLFLWTTHGKNLRELLHPLWWKSWHYAWPAKTFPTLDPMLQGSAKHATETALFCETLLQQIDGVESKKC